jgi:hypothetical protein
MQVDCPLRITHVRAVARCTIAREQIGALSAGEMMKAVPCMVVTFLMQRRFRVNPDQGPPQSNSALLIFIREPKPKKSKPTSNDQGNPTHPLRH